MTEIAPVSKHILNFTKKVERTLDNQSKIRTPENLEESKKILSQLSNRHAIDHVPLEDRSVKTKSSDPEIQRLFETLIPKM